MQNVRMFFTGIAIFVASLFMVSCSGGDSENEQKKILENATWTSVASVSHNPSAVAIDQTKPNTVILTRMQQMDGLRYTEKTVTEESVASWNLCKRAEHEADSLMSLSFAGDKCIINVKVSKSCVKAKLTKREKLYKFEEGEYIVKVGPHSYEGIKVYSYGVYRADGTLFIPLDGKGCIAYETAYSYSDKQVFDEDVNEYSINATYLIFNNQITISYSDNGVNKSIVGLLSSDGQMITIGENPIVKSIKTLKK